MSACGAAAADWPSPRHVDITPELVVRRWKRVARQLDGVHDHGSDRAGDRLALMLHRLTLVRDAQAGATESRTLPADGVGGVGVRSDAEQELADAVAVAAASAAVLAFVDPEHAPAYHAAWRADRAAAAAAGLRASAFADAEARARRSVEAVLARDGLHTNGAARAGR